VTAEEERTAMHDDQIPTSVSLDAVFRAHVGALARFAGGLLPACARETTDADDVVQDVVVSTAGRLCAIACDDDGALLAYLRRGIRHRVIDVVRRAARRPRVDLVGEQPAPGPSPLDQAIEEQNDRRLQAAIRRLKARDRKAVLLRVRDGLSYEEIAPLLGSPTANAARVTVHRAMEKLRALVEGATRVPIRG
jgi:RNA polymerase sigma factor (sigma-70 family)